MTPTDPTPKRLPSVMDLRGSNSRKNRRADLAMRKRARRQATRQLMREGGLAGKHVDSQ